MIENHIPSTDPKQERSDKKFLEKSTKWAITQALRKFNLKAKKIELSKVYTRDELGFFFDLRWELLETKLEEKFKFEIDGENVVFTEIKEEQKN